jgi:hypothetical protein
MLNGRKRRIGEHITANIDKKSHCRPEQCAQADSGFSRAFQDRRYALALPQTFVETQYIAVLAAVKQIHPNGICCPILIHA